MTLFILGLFIGATFGLMCSGLLQGRRLENYQETDHVEVGEGRYAR